MENQTLERITGGREFFITHNDLDGILSALFLMQRGYQFGGVFDLKTMYLKDGLTLDDCFAVDLDLSIPGVPSMGHHFCPFTHENHTNPNVLYGISDPAQYVTLNDYKKTPRFRRKCPLPMILILHALTETPLPTESFTRAWYLYSDGLYKSFKKYKKNVKTWLRDMNLESLIEDLESDEKQIYVEGIISTIEQFGRSLSGKGFQATNSKPFPQCTFMPLELPLLTPFLQHLQQLIYSSSDIQVPDLVTAFEGHYYRFKMNDLAYKRLEEKFQKGLMISHGLVYHSIVCVTLSTPLDEEKDLDLIRLEE